MDIGGMDIGERIDHGARRIGAVAAIDQASLATDCHTPVVECWS